MKYEWWSYRYDRTWVTTSPISNTNMRFRCIMKVISYMLCDVNASFDGDVSVKIWKGAYLLEKSFYWVPIICQVHNDGFIRNFIGLSDMHSYSFLCKRSLTWWFCLNSLMMGAYMWTKCPIAYNTWIVAWNNLLMNSVCMLYDVMLVWCDVMLI